MNKYKVLFVGTSEFAVPSLKALLEQDYINIVGIVTQPDKPQGRHQSKLVSPPVKEFISTRDINIPVFQPEKLKKAASNIFRDTSPDVIIVASYGQMIPEILLEAPKYGALNIHASLLSDLRGAVPVEMAILKGYDETGVTIQKMVTALDAGPILAQESIRIEIHNTAETLEKKLAKLGAQLLVEVLPKWVKGDIQLKKQDDKNATYCYQQDVSKDKAEIKFDTPSIKAERMIRAFYPWPVAWLQVKVQGKVQRLKVFKAKLVDCKPSKLRQLAVYRQDNNLLLGLADGTLLLQDIQLEGKRRMSAKDYLFIAEDD